MNVIINGETRVLAPVETLAALVEQLEMKSDRVAIELNREIVPREQWAQTSVKDGDRLELEFEMPLHLEAVDDQNPNNVALMRGPVALFAVGDVPTRMTHKQLLAATQVVKSSEDWSTKTDGGVLTLRPFSKIMSENYRLYQRIEA